MVDIKLRFCQPNSKLITWIKSFEAKKFAGGFKNKMKTAMVTLQKPTLLPIKVNVIQVLYSSNLT